MSRGSSSPVSRLGDAKFEGGTNSLSNSPHTFDLNLPDAFRSRLETDVDGGIGVTSTVDRGEAWNWS